MPLFDHLLRFKNPSGETWYGEAGTENVARRTFVGSTVRVYGGKTPWDPDFELLDQQEMVAEVLCPLPSVPMFICVGLNYKHHAAEAGMTIAPYPIIFTKPPDALAAPLEDISIHPECLCMDYEAELCFVIGKDCKNVSESEDAMQYVFGYTAGNDISSRYWQQPERSGHQHGSAKSFDKFAPIGPVLTSSNIIQNPHNLWIKSFVNGEIRQSARTDDLIYDIPTIIKHISRGTTLRRGTVVMTGTPSGVAAFLKPPQWLKDGDIVEVEIEKVGRIRNRMVFEKQ
ncbi:fumarylacetoacetate hydrolase family protein [Pyrenochaeta sp. MPI-SDFR-AT-0127]|nr:fumarylacetoacetate hydrolase family protein [Pyrenochaeta sp. MPI-SDFR-AT-0127]